MFGIIALLSFAHADDSTLVDVAVPDVEAQSNNGNGNGNGNNKGKNGNGKGGNGKGKGGNGKGKGGNGKGKGGNGGQKGPAKKPNPNGQGQNKANQGKQNQTKWQKMTKVKEEKNIIFRPEFGVSTLNLDGQDQSVGGANIGLSLGNEKTKRLKVADVGIYNRSRLYGSMAMGSQMGAYDFRAGTVLGVKVLHAELEAGFDLLRHQANSNQTPGIEFAASNGYGIPVQALFMSDLFKVKVGVEPRWYFDGQPRAEVPVDWTNTDKVGSLPVTPIGDEFAWTIGFRIGWFGLSYEQLIMGAGTKHTVSFGLQR
jgi:hypothetical protein